MSRRLRIEPLTVEEAQEVIRNFLRTRGEQGATEEEVRRVVNEVAYWKVLGTAASMVLRRELAVNLVDGEVTIDLPERAWPARA